MDSIKDTIRVINNSTLPDIYIYIIGNKGQIFTGYWENTDEIFNNLFIDVHKQIKDDGMVRTNIMDEVLCYVNFWENERDNEEDD